MGYEKFVIEKRTVVNPNAGLIIIGPPISGELKFITKDISNLGLEANDKA